MSTVLFDFSHANLAYSHFPKTQKIAQAEDLLFVSKSLLLPNMQRRSMIERTRHGIEDELKGGVKTIE